MSVRTIQVHLASILSNKGSSPETYRGRLRRDLQETPIDSIFATVNAWYYTTQFKHALRFKKRCGWWPNVANPKHFNERVLWRKAFDDNPMFVQFCDKLATKEYFASRCPGVKIPKTLWVGTNPEEIPEELWNSRVAIKVNCASLQNIFLRGQVVDRSKAIQQLRDWINGEPFGERFGETAYAKVERKILVEELYAPPAGERMLDIKPNACNGIVANVRIITWTPELKNDNVKRQACVMHPDGTRVWARNRPFPSDERQLPADFEAPPSFHTAVEMAKLASKGVDYARVDFLCGNEDVYGGEMTIYPGAGYDLWKPPIISEEIEAIWDLRLSWFLSNPHAGWRRRYAAALREEMRRRYGEKPPSQAVRLS